MNNTAKLDELKESSSYVRGLMDATTSPLFWIGNDGLISDINETAEGLLGITREKLIGSNVADYFSEKEKALAAYAAALQVGVIKKQPLTLKRQKGRLIEVLYSASVYKDDSGKKLGLFVTIKEAHSQTEKVLEAAEEVLAEWGYALDQIAFGSPAGFNTFRDIESEAAAHWFKRTVGRLPKTKTAYEAVTKYRDIADERKVILKENFKLEEKDENILGTFLSHDCPYRSCCSERKAENKKFACFRATPFVVAIRLMAEKEYRADIIDEQTHPGKVCMLNAIPTQLAFKVGLSYKLSTGSIKINDVDCEKLGLDLIDKVTLIPSRKELSHKKITLMSSSQNKYPSRMVIVSVADARRLGLNEKDTVFVNRAADGEEVDLVAGGEGAYEADYGL